jgi:hypothetical protein
LCFQDSVAADRRALDDRSTIGFFGSGIPGPAARVNPNGMKVAVQHATVIMDI